MIRAGKTLPVTATEIAITFKAPPHDVFGIEPVLPEDQLRFRIWPETAVGLTLHGQEAGRRAGSRRPRNWRSPSSPGRTSAPTTG